jgi:DNA-binding MarR family transcriptional regulator
MVFASAIVCFLPENASNLNHRNFDNWHDIRVIPGCSGPYTADPMEPSRWLTPEEQVAWRAFVRGSSLLLERLDAELSEAHGLTLADYEILVWLSEAPRGGLRMSELADRALVSRSRLTYRVDRLVAQGLVERRPCPSDRRGSLAVLTPTGRRRLERAAPTHVEGVVAYLVDQCSSRELAVIGKAFASVARALEAQPGEAENSDEEA